MSTRLTEHLITYGLSNTGANVLSDGGYWSLDKLLETMALWEALRHPTPRTPGMALHEYLTICGFGPHVDAQLMAALDNYQRGVPQPWAPNPVAAELVEEIVRDILSGRIEHGDHITPASHLVLAKRTTTSTAITVHRLLARRGYLAVRHRRPVALVPDSGDYQVRYCPSISEERKPRAAEAVALARRHPGLWRRAKLCRAVHNVLRPLELVEWDDAARIMTVQAITWGR